MIKALRLFVTIVMAIGRVLSPVVAFFQWVTSGWIGSMGVTFALYTWVFTWKFAIVFTMLLFGHELGKAWSMKRCGMEGIQISFQAFGGFSTTCEEGSPSAEDCIFMALFASASGLIYAALIACLYFLIKDPYIATASCVIAAFNFGNLLPFQAFDGGVIMRAVPQIKDGDSLRKAEMKAIGTYAAYGALAISSWKLMMYMGDLPGAEASFALMMR